MGNDNCEDKHTKWKKKKKMSFEYDNDDDDERMLLLDMLELNPSDCIVQPFSFDILHSDGWRCRLPNE